MTFFPFKILKENEIRDASNKRPRRLFNRGCKVDTDLLEGTLINKTD